VTDKQRLNIGAATFNSGHHTVFQHALSNSASKRQPPVRLVFSPRASLLQSEQQSQRYVRMDRVQAYVPPVDLYFNESAREIYVQGVARAWNYYRELSALLVSDTRAILGDIWHTGPNSSSKHMQKIERSAEKRAIEIARYVLPVAAFTTMVHTISGIVLHRLWRMAAAFGHAQRNARHRWRNGRSDQTTRCAIFRSFRYRAARRTSGVRRVNKIPAKRRSIRPGIRF